MHPRTRIPYLLILLTYAAWLSRALQPVTADAGAHKLYELGETELQPHELFRRVAEIDDKSGAVKGKKQDQGTKYAPVDGADGKPHAGPFVDAVENLRLIKDETSSPGSGDKVTQDKGSPEDGVMNDPHRAPPKKGTTGTEGGVTEKSRDKEAHENETGRKKIQKPESPKDVDAVSHKEDDSTISTKKPEKQKLSKGAQKSPGKNSKADEKDDKQRGALSIEKPDDFPDKPHEYPVSGSPHSDNKLSSSSSKSKATKDSYDDGHHSDSEEEEEEQEGVHDLIRWDSLFGSFTSIAATEIGDKTFIVAALMAMRHPRLQVFTAAFSALFVMTILSGICGHAVGAIISKKWSALLAAGLFLAFGGKSLKEGAEMDANQGASEEIKEVQAELEEKEVDMARANGHARISSLSPDVLESGRVERSRSRSRMSPLKRSPSTSPSPSRARPTVKGGVAGIKNLLTLLLSPAWVETFSMTFVGELGDRSQIATVAMAAGQEYYWVMVGATMGHFVCTAVAVLGGSALAGRISMRTVTFGGGVIFIGFGIFTLFEAIQYFR